MDILIAMGIAVTVAFFVFMAWIYYIFKDLDMEDY